MKIHEFRDVCICASWSVCTMCFFICVTVYGLSMLEGWFNVDDRLAEVRKEFKEDINKNINYSKEVKESIMTSCFKGEKRVNTTKR